MYALFFWEETHEIYWQPKLGRIEWRQWAGFVSRPNSLVSDFSDNSSIQYIDSVNSNFRARFRKALIRCLCWLVRWPPQTEIAYVMRETIRAVNTVCRCLGGKPWLFNSSTGIYIENKQYTSDVEMEYVLAKIHYFEFPGIYHWREGWKWS